MILLLLKTLTLVAMLAFATIVFVAIIVPRNYNYMNPLKLSAAQNSGMVPFNNNSSSYSKNNFIINNNIAEEDCLSVPGGGFSGFWLDLGRLRALLPGDQIYNEPIVCYSSGCLTVVAAMLLHHRSSSILNDHNRTNSSTNNTKSEDRSLEFENYYGGLYNMAETLQLEWRAGNLHRYDVVEPFIDWMFEFLYHDDPPSATVSPFLDAIRNNLYVATTIFDESIISKGNGNGGIAAMMFPKGALQRPVNIPSLKELLLQTTWIPYVTGRPWTHRSHADGAFSTAQHPRCSRTTYVAGIPSLSVSQQAKLLIYTLNMGLSKPDVKEFLNLGLEWWGTAAVQ